MWWRVIPLTSQVDNIQKLSSRLEGWHFLPGSCSLLYAFMTPSAKLSKKNRSGGWISEIRIYRNPRWWVDPGNRKNAPFQSFRVGKNDFTALWAVKANYSVKNWGVENEPYRHGNTKLSFLFNCYTQRRLNRPTKTNRRTDIDDFNFLTDISVNVIFLGWFQEVLNEKLF